MSVPTLTLTTGCCVPALVTRCPERWGLPNRWMTIWVLCSNGQMEFLVLYKNFRRVVAESFVMKQRVRAVGVRSQ